MLPDRNWDPSFKETRPITQYQNWITEEIDVFLDGAGVVGRPGRTRGESLPLLKFNLDKLNLSERKPVEMYHQRTFRLPFKFCISGKYL